MRELQLTWDGVSMIWQKGTKQWTCQIKRSAINVLNVNVLNRLAISQMPFLPQTIEVGDSEVTFTYTIEDHGLELSDVRALPMMDKLRIALNSLDLRNAQNYPVGLLLHPENLFITKNGTFKIAYRALPDVMVPYQQTPSDFFRQQKCLIITLLSDESFSRLYDGGLEAAHLSNFLDEIRQAETFTNLQQILAIAYEEQIQLEQRQFKRVSALRYKVYQQAALWLGILALFLALPLIYLTLFRDPFQAKLLNADYSFMKKDYSKVIADLEGISSHQLPNTQKYELAYSYIQKSDLSEEQEATVLESVTLDADRLYSEYWIAIGRGKANEAIDIAKRLDDLDLMIYAIAAEMEVTRQSEDMTSEARDSKLKGLEGDYQKYLKERDEVMQRDTNVPQQNSEVFRHE